MLPVVLALPLGFWIALIALPALDAFIAPYLPLLTHDVTLYAVLGGVAILAGLMRQWRWWYWLGLTCGVWLATEYMLAQPLATYSGLLLPTLLPLFTILFSRVLSGWIHPPLWTFAGVLWLLVLVGWPWGLTLLPLDHYLPQAVVGIFTGSPLVAGISSSAVTLLVLAVIGLSWLWQRMRTPSQPRQWAELILAVQLVLLVLSMQAPEMMRLAVLSMALVMLLGLTMQMLNLAYIDELTQIPGRRALYADMAKLGRRSAVTMLDVDHFKKFNDNYGHDVGDQTLRLIASQLKRSRGFKCYRYGGEEFTLLFNHQDPARISEDLEAARQAIASYPVKIRQSKRPRNHKKGRKLRGQQGAKTVRVTVSLGCAIRQPKESDQQLIKRADTLLYKAKKAGRNRVVLQ